MIENNMSDSPILHQSRKRCERSSDEGFVEYLDDNGNLCSSLPRKRFKRSDEDDHGESTKGCENDFDFADLFGEKSCDEYETLVDLQVATQLQCKENMMSSICEALREAQEIFGTDFHFDEIYKYGNEYVERTTENDVYDNVCEAGKFNLSNKKTNLSDFDDTILTTDVPERLLLRSPPITSASKEELILESQWIYNQAFKLKTISIQNSHLKPEARKIKDSHLTSKIAVVLDLMRNQKYEVPFIAFYRKEYILPELNINDLWKICKFDAKWCEFRRRKDALLKLFKVTKAYQEANPSEINRLLQEDEIEYLENAQTFESLTDCYRHFALHYNSKISQLQRRVSRGEDFYSVCRQAGLDDFVNKLGLSPRQFAENLSQQRQVHEFVKEFISPHVLASNYTSEKFQTVEQVLQSAQLMLATQLATEPLIRESICKLYTEKATISIQPTQKGIRVIDEHHPIYTMKYLKDKPVKDLVGEQYLKLSIAQDDGLITIGFSNGVEEGYVERMKQVFYQDTASQAALEWNSLWAGSIELALIRILIPDLKKQLHSQLLSEAKDCILRHCCRRVYNWIKVAPYHSQYPSDKDWDTTPGLRVMGVTYVSNEPSTPAFACIISPEGECSEYLNLPNFVKMNDDVLDSEKLIMETALTAVKSFIAAKKPHVIAVAGESVDAMKIAEEFRKMVKSLVEEKQFPEIAVEIVENEPAIVYSNSQRGIEEFPSYLVVLRQAISLARRLQDPLIELSQLCNDNDEVLSLKLHELQDKVDKDELLDNVYLEFVNRVNEVGVDVDKAMRLPYFGNLLQFVSGFGPQKAKYLIETLKKADRRLESRHQLSTLCNLGPNVFTNCAGFIKIIDVKDILDGTRIHLQNYDWAADMATNALDLEDEIVDLTLAMEKILECPEKLKNLDLDAWSADLQKQGYGNRCITVNDIRSELTTRYKDLRVPYKSPTANELFAMFSKESPANFYVGKLVNATVVGLGVGITHIRLDNGIPGYIHAKNVSDDHTVCRVSLNKNIRCRVVKIDLEKLSVEATSRESDLEDKKYEWRLLKDMYYDFDAELDDNPIDQPQLQPQQQQFEQNPIPANPILTHRCFKNVTWRDAEYLLQTMPQGETIIRPSSRGRDHLCFTWKVTDGIIQHILVRNDSEKDKLIIGNEEFQSVDDIIIRHIDSMVAYTRELLNFKYYNSEVMGDLSKAEKILEQKRKASPMSIPYIISAARSCPGKFVLSYLPRSQCRHNNIIISPVGFKFGGRCFTRLTDLIGWFKTHSKDPIPEPTTPIASKNYDATFSMQLQRISPLATPNVYNKQAHMMYHPQSQVINQTPYVSHKRKRLM